MASPTPTKVAPFKMDGSGVKCEIMGCVYVCRVVQGSSII